jgi:hypothetical protein
MVKRGPTLSNHLPAKAADKPKNTIAKLKIQPRLVNFQSLAVDALTPKTRVNGSLKTLKLYTSPIDKWTAKAAGGINQRLKLGLAMMRSLLKKFIFMLH